MSSIFRNPFYNWVPPTRSKKGLTDDEKELLSRGPIGKLSLLTYWAFTRYIIPTTVWFMREFGIPYIRYQINKWSARIRLCYPWVVLLWRILSHPQLEGLLTGIVYRRFENSLPLFFGLLSDLSTGIQRGVAQIGLVLFRIRPPRSLLYPVFWLVFHLILRISALLSGWARFKNRIRSQVRSQVRYRLTRIRIYLRWRSVLLLPPLTGLVLLLYWESSVVDPLLPALSLPNWSVFLPLPNSPGWPGYEVLLPLSQVLAFSFLLLGLASAVPAFINRWVRSPYPPRHRLIQTLYYRRPGSRFYQILFGGLFLLTLILLPAYRTIILWKTWTTWPFSLYYHPYIWIRGFWILPIGLFLYGWKRYIFAKDREARRWWSYSFLDKVKFGRWYHYNYQYDPVLQLYFPMEMDSNRYVQHVGFEKICHRLYFFEKPEHFWGPRVELLEDRVSIASPEYVDLRAWRERAKEHIAFDWKLLDFPRAADNWGVRTRIINRIARPGLEFYKNYRDEYITRPPTDEEAELEKREVLRTQRKWAAQLAGTWDEEEERLNKAHSEAMAEAWDAWWRKETPWDYNFWTYYEKIEGRDPPQAEFNEEFSKRVMGYAPSDHMEGTGKDAHFVDFHYDSTCHYPYFKRNFRHA